MNAEKKEIRQIDIRYLDGTMITIDNQMLETLELLNKAKETAKRFMNITECGLRDKI